MQDFEINTKINNWNKKRTEIINWLYENGYNNIKLDDSTSKSFFPLPDIKLSDLKVAAIMDRFTLESYSPECKLLELTPDGWKEDMDSFKPDMLFIESAWKGKDDLWYRKVDRYSDELKELTDYCHNRSIPVIFWNKEDPVYTDTFMLTASYADVVFTTDVDCIAKYKTELGHDNVYHLHFAAQPKIHNPIEKYDRKDKFCFAGAYYHKYTDRCKVFDDFAEEFINRKGFDIYDRNYPAPLPEHAFPEKYNKLILGSLPSNEIDKAYKGYVYGINMNSILQSQTMFARRVFEMLASNTITVGNFSRGLKNYFGDLTICTNDTKTLALYLEKYMSDSQKYRKYRLLGLRKVLSEDLYEDRLSYIAEKVFGKQMKTSLPVVTVYSSVNNDTDKKRINEMFEKQTYKNKKLVIISDKKDKIVKPKEGFIAVFDPSDWYGENYLLDLMLTLRYYKADGIGKFCYYSSDGKEIKLNGKEVYTAVSELKMRRAVVDAAKLDISDYASDKIIKSANLFSVDEFNYCENYRENECNEVSDLYIADKGLSLSKIEKCAEAVKPLEISEGVLRITGEELSHASLSDNLPVKFIANGKQMTIESDLPDGKHEYIYLQNTKFDASAWLVENKLPVYFKGAGNLDLICVVVCFDKNNKKIGALYPHLNRNDMLELPNGTESCVLGFRPKGKGSAIIKEVLIGTKTESSDKTCFLSRSDTLILSNHYPSIEALYRNMFVHKRMTSYKDSGFVYDVMRMNPYAKEEYREFEGINVIETKGAELINILESGTIKTICVHFLDREMWEILKNYLGNIRLLIWQHGAEVQPWWRREYNYTTEEELNEGKKASDERMKLWYEIFDAAKNNKNIKFVYVSQYFANEVMSDYKIKLDESQYTIIHNMIDTEMFKYEKKDVKQRMKVLTIKPFASNKYANDLTTNGIVELSKRECFKNIDINIYGQGVLFKEVNKPLKKFDNVHLHEVFLTQSEISEIHKEHGIYIATTRMDAQGVSRDEAMSSGLVPIASNCTAIPEFVDENCGILVPAESYVEIADAIENLYNNPELFSKLSENAAKRVRNQTSKEFTIDKEINLIETKMNRGM